MTRSMLQLLFAAVTATVASVNANTLEPDTHTMCDQWADNLECDKNPRWMLIYCPTACDRVLLAKASKVVEYGLDMSYPMTKHDVSSNFAGLPWNVDPSVETPPEYQGEAVSPFRGKQEFYNNLMEGCKNYYGKEGYRCMQYEVDRYKMSEIQPRSMYNFTSMGFTKIRAPERVFQLIKEFWEWNKDEQQPEQWATGNSYVNHWDTQSTMVHVDNTTLRGGGYVLKQHIWNAVRDTISEWTGMQLHECSLYGIRTYYEGAVLATHVDRLPLVSSAIINVDQDVDEPWPLEVIGHDGKAYNVTMEPGDLVLYESHSVLHGRPFPLKGKFMANIFIHFEPIGRTGRSITTSGDLPPYVIRGSEWESQWRERFPQGWNVMQKRDFTTGSTEAHHFAMNHDKESLIKLLDRHADYANAKDQNGWTPLHEAVRARNIGIVEALVERGSDFNAQTAQGYSVLNLAKVFTAPDDGIVSYLEGLGARDYGSEL